MRYQDNDRRKLQFSRERTFVLSALRHASWILILLPCGASAPTAARAQQLLQTPVPTPPLYQRFRDPSGKAVSLVYGVGEIGKPPAPATPRHFPRLAAYPSCASPPPQKELQTFSLFQWMDKQQAVSLGLLFRAPDGAERPFLGTDALVWRSGATATCLSTDGTRTVVYGWEWDVGLVVERSASSRGPDTFATLQARTPPAVILSFGENVNGAIEQQPLLQQALARLWTDWQSGPSGQLTQTFLEHFDEAKRAGKAPGQQPPAIQAIGYFLKP